MNLNVVWRVAAAAVVVSGWSASAEVDESRAAEVKLPRGVLVFAASGRGFAGDVDLRTDDEQLWIRSGDSALSVVRPVAWDRVRAVTFGCQTVPGGVFRELIESLRPEGSFGPEPPQVIVMRGEGRGEIALPERAAPARDEGDRVRWLDIDVWADNWDSDAAQDGLVVQISPFDGQGRLVPVRGTLRARLYAQRHAGRGHRDPFARRQRWTRAVREADFGPGGAIYRLPFAPKSTNPEFDLLVSKYGAVLVELDVPGEGTLAATASSVRIRAGSIVRDALQRATSTRFFPGERTGAGR